MYAMKKFANLLGPIILLLQSCFANVDLLNQVFVNQIQTELYLIRDILDQTSKSYHINKDQFVGVGLADSSHPDSLSQSVPNHFCIDNLYAFVNDSQQIQVDIVFKSQQDNLSCSNLLADTTLSFYGLSNLNQIITIDYINDHENDIIAYSCTRLANSSGQTFGVLNNIDGTGTNVDLAISLPPPLNQCEIIED